MPSFYSAVELLARVVDTVVVLLVVDWSCETVAEHTLRKRREGIDWIFIEESGGGGGVALGSWYTWV